MRLEIQSYCLEVVHYFRPHGWIVKSRLHSIDDWIEINQCRDKFFDKIADQSRKVEKTFQD
jgi:hypothetical protein